MSESTRSNLINLQPMIKKIQKKYLAKKTKFNKKTYLQKTLKLTRVNFTNHSS
jgi:membrane protein insertase Oxa1/YidC/SpoIIIJ